MLNETEVWWNRLNGQGQGYPHRINSEFWQLLVPWPGVEEFMTRLTRVPTESLGQRGFSLKDNSKGQDKIEMNHIVFCFLKADFFKLPVSQIGPWSSSSTSLPSASRHHLPVPNSRRKQQLGGEISQSSVHIACRFSAGYFPLPVENILSICPATLFLFLFSFSTASQCVWLPPNQPRFPPLHCGHSIMSDSLWPMNCSPPGSLVHGIFQARMLEWVTIPFSSGSSQPRDQTQVSCIAGKFLTTESPGKPASTHCDQPHPKHLSLCPPPPDTHTFTTTSGWCYCQSPDLVDTCKASSPLALSWHPVLPLTIPSLSFFFFF